MTQESEKAPYEIIELNKDGQVLLPYIRHSGNGSLVFFYNARNPSNYEEPIYNKDKAFSALKYARKALKKRAPGVIIDFNKIRTKIDKGQLIYPEEAEFLSAHYINEAAKVLEPNNITSVIGGKEGSIQHLGSLRRDGSVKYSFVKIWGNVDNQEEVDDQYEAAKEVYVKEFREIEDEQYVAKEMINRIKESELSPIEEIFLAAFLEKKNVEILQQEHPSTKVNCQIEGDEGYMDGLCFVDTGEMVLKEVVFHIKPLETYQSDDHKKESAKHILSQVLRKCVRVHGQSKHGVAVDMAVRLTKTQVNKGEEIDKLDAWLLAAAMNLDNLYVSRGEKSTLQTKSSESVTIEEKSRNIFSYLKSFIEKKPESIIRMGGNKGKTRNVSFSTNSVQEH